MPGETLYNLRDKNSSASQFSQASKFIVSEATDSSRTEPQLKGIESFSRGAVLSLKAITLIAFYINDRPLLISDFQFRRSVTFAFNITDSECDLIAHRDCTLNHCLWRVCLVAG
jgi:hypothetical protein